MKFNLQTYIDNYEKWLFDNRNISKTKEPVVVNSPCLDRHNDYFQIHIKKQGNKEFLISDDNYTVDDLEMSGCDVTGVDKPMLNYLAGRNGAAIGKNNNIYAVAFLEDLAQTKHDVLQAMLSINDIFYIEKNTKPMLFNSEMVKWLVASEIRFISQFKVEGVSGINHFCDFVIPKSQQSGERFLFACNCADRAFINNLAYLWNDIAPNRDNGSKCYIFVNDENKMYMDKFKDSQAVCNQLEAPANMTIIPWTKRSEFLPDLIA